MPKRSPHRKLASYQKACPKCRRVIHADLRRCPSCEYAPWTWHPNLRFFIATVVAAALLLTLAPFLSKNDKPDRVPVVSASAP
jgi:hypothetical protein